MNIKGAIFDLDGTLLDSMPLWNTMGSDYLIRRGITPEPDINKIFLTYSLAQDAEYYRANYGITDSVEEISNQINSYVEEGYRDIVKPKPGIPEFLQYLKNNGVKMCVATATEHYLVETVLKRNGLDGFFEGILTCGEVGAGKNVPDIFLKAIELLNVPKESTVVFEDAPHAIKTAKNAGFMVAGIADDSYAKESEYIRAMCDIYVTSYFDLANNGFDL